MLRSLRPMRIIRYILGLSLLAASSAGWAQASGASQINLNVDDLCQYVAENPAETDSSRGTRFVYQTRLFAAAGVDPHTDTREVISSKMQAWWSQHQHLLICNVTNSIVRDGSILKLAVDSSSSEFINDVVRRWRVDLNRIDADGTTVLDFIEQQRERNRTSSRFQILDNYYTIFVTNGAKHARDLR